MGLAFTVDNSQFNQWVNKYNGEIKRDMVAGLKQEMGLLIRAGIMFTPPFTKTRSKENKGSSKAARIQGETAVERDIRVVLLDLNGFIKFMIRLGARKETMFRIMVLAMARDVRGLQEIFKKWHGLARVTHVGDSGLAQVHNSERRQGVIHHTPRQRMFVLDTSVLNDYIADIKKHVGRAKAGWNAAASKFGVKDTTAWPAWVKRHAGRGSATDNLSTTTGSGYLEGVNADIAIGVLNSKKNIEGQMYSSRITAMNKMLQNIMDRTGKRLEKYPS